MLSQDEPLVSCICLTHHNLNFLKRSIRCFHDQTYHNKELIVAFTDNNKTAIGLIDELGDPLIRPVVFSSQRKLTLGEKRNAAIEHARGYYICIWDDDDWHHIKRIELQVKSLYKTDYKASILSKLILYDGVTKNSYFSATRWGWEQTLLCQKSLFDLADWGYKPLDRGEDSSLVYNLKHHNFLLSLASPYLYIYVYHSANVFHRGHWEVNLLPWAKQPSLDNGYAIEAILQGNITNAEASALLEKFS